MKSPSIVTQTVMKPTIENGKWVFKPFLLTTSPTGARDEPAAIQGKSS